ncbi:hypothetical protein [Actinopolymorpha cephalotaxi]|nr:hypothetical protein [Actinopolymorpha cephalotaxi]
MGRIWRSLPGWLLVSYALLLLLLLGYTEILSAVMGAYSPLGVAPVPVLISVGLAWLVWCRIRLAWCVLVTLSVLTLFVIVVSSDVTAYNFPLFPVLGAHVAILLSPAIRTHVARPAGSAPPPAPDTA